MFVEISPSLLLFPGIDQVHKMRTNVDWLVFSEILTGLIQKEIGELKIGDLVTMSSRVVSKDDRSGNDSATGR